MRGRGCNYCYLTGYRGRIGVYELLEIDSLLTEKIGQQDIDGFLAAANKSRGYVPLARGAIGYAIAGTTSIDEAIRISGGLDYETVPRKAAASGDGAH
ncbi:MAG: hypothetical protein U5K38_02215 [Woeseiaceae bacterium]|nr:hypothetical protein [Woeseiaceae bacterium]